MPTKFLLHGPLHNPSYITELTEKFLVQLAKTAEEGGSLILTAEEVQELHTLLTLAPNAARAELENEARMRQDFAAYLLVLDGDQKEALRLKGWLPPKGWGKKIAFPVGPLLQAFINVTQMKGDVLVWSTAPPYLQAPAHDDDEVVWPALSLPPYQLGVISIPNCPLDPKQAIVTLCEAFDYQSPSALLKQLETQRTKLSNLRELLKESGQSDKADLSPDVVLPSKGQFELWLSEQSSGTESS